jgi:hypothetical protein
MATLMATMAPSGAATAMNANPGFVKALFTYLDMDRLGSTTDKTWAAASRIQGKLDPVVIAGIANSNGSFITRLISKIDIGTLSSGMNTDTDFVSRLVSKLDPGVMAEIINSNGAFISQLMDKLDPKGTARVINDNADFMANLVSFLKPDVIAGVINDPQGSTYEVMSELKPDVIARVVNANAAFIDSLLSALKADMVIGAIDTNDGQELIRLMLNPDPNTGGMDPRVIAQTINHNPAFAAKLMENLNPGVIVQIINSNPDFIKGLVGNLDADVINAAADAATLYSYDSGGPKGIFYDMVRPYDARNPETSGLNPQVIAALINSNAPFIGELMEKINPAQIANLLATDNGKKFINNVLTGVNGSDTALANLAQVLAGNPEMSHQLLLALAEPAALSFLANQVNAPGENNVLHSLTLKIKNHVEAPVEIPGSPIPGLKIQISDEFLYAVPLEVAVKEYPYPW